MISTDANAVRGVLNEISNALTRIAAERDFIKEAIAEAAEKHQIDKKLLRKMAKIHHKGNYTQEKQSAEELLETYANIVNP